MRSLFASALALFLLLSAWVSPPGPLSRKGARRRSRRRSRTLNTPREFPKIAFAEGMAGTGQRDSRAGARELRPVADAGEDPAPGAVSSARSSATVTAWRRSISSRCPAFTSAGNLYRPLGRGKGPFPAILNPHGHWKEGRLADTKDGSIAAPLHQLRAPGHDRVFLRHGGL